MRAEHDREHGYWPGQNTHRGDVNLGAVSDTGVYEIRGPPPHPISKIPV